MIMPGKKKMVTTIVAGLGKKKPDFVQELGEEGYTAKEIDLSKPEKEADIGLLSAAEDIISAIKDGNAEALNEALSAHYDMYSIQMGEDEADDIEDLMEA